MTAALRRAGFLRTAALVPDVDATPPPGWDEEEDGLFNAGFVDGVDGASVGGFFRCWKWRPDGLGASGSRAAE